MPTLNAIFQDAAGNALTSAVILRPLCTPLADGARLISGGDIVVTPDSTGSISVVLAPGRYRLLTAWDRPVELLLPNDNDSHSLAHVAPLTSVGVSSSRLVYYGVSASTMLDAAGILALGSVSRSSLTGTYAFPAGDGYYFFAFPDGFGSPASGTGFMLGAFPVDMATAEDGFSSTENGWSYTAISAGGIAYRLYRSTNVLGDSAVISVQ